MNLLALAWSRFLFPRSHAFRQYEAAAIELVIGSLDPAVADSVRSQIEAHPSVQRHLGVETVFMWRYDAPFVDYDGVPRVVNASLVRAARVFGKLGPRAVRCDIEFRDGLLYRLFFNRVLEPSDTVSWVTTQILDGLTTIPEPVPGTGGKLVRSVSAKHRVDAVIAPRSLDYSSMYLDGLETAIPDDLRALLEETNGFNVDGFEFVGTNAYAIWTPKGAAHAFLVKEDASSALCILEGADQASVCDYDTVEHQVEDMGPSFLDAMDSFLARQNAFPQ